MTESSEGRVTETGDAERRTDDTEPKSPEQIRAEIDQTREELGDTVEALAAKADVKAQAQDRITTVKQGLADNVTQVKTTVAEKKEEFTAKAKQATPESASAGAQQLGTTVQENPVPFIAGGAFFVGLITGLLMRRR